MLKPAQLYKEEIQRKMIETWYDEKYQFYYNSSSHHENMIPDNCDLRRCFASLDKNGNVIGYISYMYDDVSGVADCFGIISFDIGNSEFAVDVLRVFDDIFTKFSLNRIEFMCFERNPTIRAYRNFIKRYGGREVCTMRETARLMDGQMHNSVLFEILYQDLVWVDEEGISKLNYDRLKLDNRGNE